MFTLRFATGRERDEFVIKTNLSKMFAKYDVVSPALCVSVSVCSNSAVVVRSEMTRGKTTTRETRNTIRRMRINGTSVKKISEKLHVPLRTVYYFLSPLSNRGRGVRRRCRRPYSPRTVRRVIAEARKYPHLGVFRISENLGFPPTPNNSLVHPAQELMASLQDQETTTADPKASRGTPEIWSMVLQQP